MRFMHTAVVVAITVLSMPVAQAASLASASISALSFTLIDLDPNDGVTSSFSFLTTEGSTTFSLSANDSSRAETESVSSSSEGTFGVTRDQWLSLTNSAVLGGINNEKLSVSGVANGPGTSFSGSVTTGSVGFLFYSDIPKNLSLTANSLLLIDTTYALVAEASNPQACDSSYYSYACPSTELATAIVTSSLSYRYSNDPTIAAYAGTESRSLQSSASGSYTSSSNPNSVYYNPIFTVVPGTEQFKQESGTLRSVFSNSSDSTQSASLYLAVSVQGQAMTAAVPEPSTYALMLLGLGGIGLVASRQRPLA